MPKQPTGRPTGRPRNRICASLLDELNEPTNKARDWDQLFDLYNYLEERDAPDTILKAVQDLIEKADTKMLKLRRDLEDMFIELRKSKSYKKQTQILKSSKAKAFKNSPILRGSIQKLINKLADTKSVITKDDYYSLYNNVLLDDPGEILFVFEYLEYLAQIALRKGSLMTKGKSVTIPWELLDKTTLSNIAGEAFGKVFRDGTYDQYKSIIIKKAFLKVIFLSVLRDYVKHMYDVQKKSA